MNWSTPQPSFNRNAGQCHLGQFVDDFLVIVILF